MTHPMLNDWDDYDEYLAAFALFDDQMCQIAKEMAHRDMNEPDTMNTMYTQGGDE